MFLNRDEKEEIQNKISKDLDTKIKEKAFQDACMYMFCNVEEEDFPKDVNTFLRSFDPSYWGGDLEKDGKTIIVWEPFVDMSVDSLIETLDNFYDSLCDNYYKIAEMVYLR